MKEIFCKYLNIKENKILEFQVSFFKHYGIMFEVRYDGTKKDHNGFIISFSILGLYTHLHFYDIRHVDKY